MEVEVRVYGRLVELLNITSLKVNIEDNISLRDLLRTLDKLNPQFYKTIVDEDGRLKQGYIILVNGESVEDLDLKVTSGSRVDILPPAVGGRISRLVAHQSSAKLNLITLNRTNKYGRGPSPTHPPPRCGAVMRAPGPPTTPYNK